MSDADLLVQREVLGFADLPQRLKSRRRLVLRCLTDR
jgi:hypothetical protein